LDICYEDRYSVENIDFMTRTINDAWSLLFLTSNFHLDGQRKLGGLESSLFSFFLTGVLL